MFTFVKIFGRMVFSSVAMCILAFFLLAAYIIYDHLPNISQSPSFNMQIGYAANFLLFYGLPCGFCAVIVYHFVAKRYGGIRDDNETRCRKCGYILKGITEPRCSECGEWI